MKLHVQSDSVYTDFVTSKQRLSKKAPQADFNLADSDDFFGFSESMKKTTGAIEISLYIILATFVVYYVFVALSFILNG